MNDNSAFHFSTDIRVRLPETDAMGIVFHGNFFTYLEVGRVDYLRNLGLSEGIRPIRDFENVVVSVEDEPSDAELLDLGLDPDKDTLFGLYQGVPLPDRDPSLYSDLPDRIVIYRLPLLEACNSRGELLQEIRDTVIHEIGHYFGFDDDELP